MEQSEQFLLRIIELLEEIKTLLEPKKRPRHTNLKNTRTLEEQIELYRGRYSPSMIEDFQLYWSEGNLWQKQKTWDIEKRLQRWKRQQDKWQYEREARQQLKNIEERPIDKGERQDGFQKLFN